VLNEVQVHKSRPKYTANTKKIGTNTCPLLTPAVVPESIWHPPLLSHHPDRGRFPAPRLRKREGKSQKVKKWKHYLCIKNKMAAETPRGSPSQKMLATGPGSARPVVSRSM